MAEQGNLQNAKKQHNSNKLIQFSCVLSNRTDAEQLSAAPEGPDKGVFSH